MERCVFILTNDSQKIRLDDYFAIFRQFFSNKSESLDGIYYGAEYCERLLPSATAAENVFLQLRKNKINFSLVTPVIVTERGIKKLKSIFSNLNKYQNVEVIVNDWGVLELIQGYGNLSPILGRGMNKIKRDPRFNFKEFTKNQYEALRGCSFSNFAYVNFLKQKRIKRVEIDNVEQGVRINFSKLGLKAHLCLPLVPIAFSQYCIFGSTHLRLKDKFRMNSPCRKECFDYYIYNYVMETKHSRGLKIKVIGRGYYQENCKVSSIKNFERLVIVNDFSTLQNEGSSTNSGVTFK